MRTAPAREPRRRVLTLARARHGRVWWLLGLLATGAFYVWTASSSGNPIDLSDGQPGYYGLLADGFKSGHLYLSVEPARQLLELANPFDAVANAPYRLHDASLYKGHYYLYFGPVPALVAFLPWDLLPLGGPLPENLAAALFGLAGLLFSVLLMRFLVRRWLPATPAWMMAVGAVALAFCNIVPFALRRPSVYEVALGAGYCFSAAGAWLVLSGALSETRSLRRIVLGSLCLGLAVGCRPNLGVLGVALLPAAYVLARYDASRRRVAAAAFGPFAFCGIALMAYNLARFGNPVEFGQSYQLAGVDIHTKKSFSLAYLVPGLFYYLLAPARHDIVFPFFHISPPPTFPGTLPAGYDGVEAVGGMLTNVPLTLLAVLALALPLHARLGLPRVLGRVLAGGVAVALLLAGFVSVLFWGATERYQVDAAWWLVLSGLMVWFALGDRLRSRPRARVAVQAAGVLVVSWGVLFAAAISITGYYDGLRVGNPGTYRTLAGLFSPLQTAAAGVAGKPLMLEVSGVPLESHGPGERYLSAATFTLPVPAQAAIEVQAVSPSRRAADLIAAVSGATPGWRVRVVDAEGRVQVVAADGGTHRIVVRLRRGLNRLRLEPLAPGPDAPASTIHVDGLRLVAGS
jgi:hypothetical protein